ncbi:TFIIH C1-like domain containing protein [Parasponia andersonii]|uniref:TFIIH C1-like domain containing protein n=1 Tax=Parasponia andersonii TaxID=3476 RepID=A0A2P5DH66_PARAD|nr:TFIIH C1-like domain containing protein [Parasponia andersonii]
MTFLLTSGRENVEKHPVTYPCSYCHKDFSNSRALGSHLRSHQDEARSRRNWNISGRSSNSLNIASPTPNPLLTTQFFSRGNRSTFPCTTPSLVFQKGFRTNDNSWVNVGRFPDDGIGNTKTQFYVTPNFSSVGGIHHFNPFSPAASASAGCITVGSIPADRSFLLGSDMICQFNTDQSRAFRDGDQFSENAVPDFQFQNPGNLCCPAFAAVIPDPHLGSNQLPAFKAPSSVVPLIPYQHQFSGREDFGQYDKNRILTRDGAKRRCLGEAPRVRVPIKRPKINCNQTLETEKPQKKELLLFKDVEKSFSGLEISFDANEELRTDLDLSLHL